jgi:hypothetical protein
VIEQSNQLCALECSTQVFATKLEQLSVLIPSSGEHDVRDDSVRAMVKRESHLASACATLAPTLNNVAVIILARALLENLITLLWVIDNPDNPDNLRLEKLNQMRQAARKNMKQGLLKILKRPEELDCTNDFLNRPEFIKIAKRKSVEQRAKESDFHDIYSVFYSFLSMELHGYSIRDPEEPPSTVMCEDLQCIGAFLNCSVLVAESWLSFRRRPSNEQLREALGLSNKRGGA